MRARFARSHKLTAKDRRSSLPLIRTKILPDIWFAMAIATRFRHHRFRRTVVNHTINLTSISGAKISLILGYSQSRRIIFRGGRKTRDQIYQYNNYRINIIRHYCDERSPVLGPRRFWAQQSVATACLQRLSRLSDWCPTSALHIGGAIDLQGP